MSAFALSLRLPAIIPSPDLFAEKRSSLEFFFPFLLKTATTTLLLEQHQHQNKNADYELRLTPAN